MGEIKELYMCSFPRTNLYNRRQYFMKGTVFCLIFTCRFFIEVGVEYFVMCEMFRTQHMSNN